MNYKQIIALILLALAGLWAEDTYAAEGTFYLQIHAGKQGSWLTKNGSDTYDWDGEEAIAAVFRAGYRRAIYVDVIDGVDIVAGAELEHHSHWDKGWPSDDDGESELDSATVFIGVEF